jgi:hypothetical protein
MNRTVVFSTDEFRVLGPIYLATGMQPSCQFCSSYSHAAASLDRCDKHSAIAVPDSKKIRKPLFKKKNNKIQRYLKGIPDFVWNTTKAPALSGMTQVLQSFSGHPPKAGRHSQALDG